MSYATECTGDITLDIYRSLSQQGGSFLHRGSALACKFVPTSRCLDFITFYGIRRIANVSIRFEIREDDGDKPKGAPGSSTGRLADIIVPYGNIPATFGNLSVDFAVMLPEANRTYWIVILPGDYYCSNSYIGEAYKRVEMSFSWITGNMRKVYSPSDLYCSPPGSCCWYLIGGNDSWPIATYKKTYTPPACTTPNITMTIPA